jgi:hypothetical protein
MRAGFGVESRIWVSAEAAGSLGRLLLFREDSCLTPDERFSETASQSRCPTFQDAVWTLEKDEEAADPDPRFNRPHRLVFMGIVRLPTVWPI